MNLFKIKVLHKKKIVSITIRLIQVIKLMKMVKIKKKVLRRKLDKKDREKKIMNLYLIELSLLDKMIVSIKEINSVLLKSIIVS